MGGSESKEVEVEYNHLKEQVQEWEEADATQMLQIESFHRSIAMRSSHQLGEDDGDGGQNQNNSYKDPETYILQQQQPQQTEMS